MSLKKIMKMGAVALVAAIPAMADKGGDCVAAASYDFITRTMGHITYTILRPSTTYDPYPEYLQFADVTSTVTVTISETIVSTVVTTTTLSAVPTQNPLRNSFPQAAAGFEKRNVLTVTVTDECDSLSAPSSIATTAASGSLLTTTTISATSTTTATGAYSLTYPLGLSTVETTTPAVLTTPITPSAPSSSDAESTTDSISTSSLSTSAESSSSVTGTFSSAVSTQSSYTVVPTVGESAPSKPASTSVSGSDRVVPGLAAVAMMLVFAA
ncbi:hypothetical protein SEPCBS57363_001986 [Sporothrix epigloea]|uniref:Uncharacterized protein n=1 Tax=Sporothrix epigloea TaxID=1892477 RepID=A0ABP0DGJ6_9PEZI